MSWNLQGEWIESCSCEMVCPCNFGPDRKATQGWCSAAIGLNIRQGASDGVDLSNARAVFVGDFPGNFALGNGVGRVYLDEAMSEDQRRELEAILTGQRGGIWEALAGGAISTMLPAKVARITLDSGDSPSVSVSGIGEMQLQRVKDEKGNQAELANSPVATAFGLGVDELAVPQGEWSDPELRSWPAGGSGGVMRFNWQV
jgi:hypothetical protein